MLTNQYQRALEAIRNVADYHREHAKWPENVLASDMCFDDWASEVAATVLNNETEFEALIKNVPPWVYDLTAGYFAK